VIVPSIRFSSQMSSSPKSMTPSEPVRAPVHQQSVEESRQLPVEAPSMMAPASPADGLEPLKRPPPEDPSTLFEVDSTLTNLARVAQELTQQKLAAIERESALEQWQARLQQEQEQLDQKVRELEQRTTQLHDHSLAVSQRTEALKVMTSQVSGLRQSLRGVLLELDQALDG